MDARPKNIFINIAPQDIIKQFGGTYLKIFVQY